MGCLFHPVLCEPVTREGARYKEHVSKYGFVFVLRVADVGRASAARGTRGSEGMYRRKVGINSSQITFHM